MRHLCPFFSRLFSVYLLVCLSVSPVSYPLGLWTQSPPNHHLFWQPSSGKINHFVCQNSLQKFHTHLDKLCTIFLLVRSYKELHLVCNSRRKIKEKKRNVIDVKQKQFSPLLFHKLLTICVTPEHLLILSTSKQHILIGLPLIEIFSKKKKIQKMSTTLYLFIILVSLVEVQSSLWKSKTIHDEFLWKWKLKEKKSVMFHWLW